MSYFPKHYVKTNQYTQGGEFLIKETLAPYVGPYFQTGNNKFFTGETPQSSNVFELVKIDTTQSPAILNTPVYYGPFFPTDNIYIPNSLDESVRSYLNVKNTTLLYPLKYLPVYNPTLPTQQDYQNGEFRRYFCKKTNEIIYLEVNIETYNKLVNKTKDIEWTLYLPFNIPWKLTGDKQDVSKVNRNITLNAMKTKGLSFFDQYLKFDFTKYYQE